MKNLYMPFFCFNSYLLHNMASFIRLVLTKEEA